MMFFSCSILAKEVKTTPEGTQESLVTESQTLLDEIDKMSQDIHGDPASAFLEVLDPEQNKFFSDHFLDICYDLSKVMFIATANTIDGIPYPLFDRMEIINLAGYTEDEKVEIAKKFLVPKNLKEYGLTEQFKLPKTIMHSLVSQYTREAGVRQLERVITKLMRKTIQLLLKHPDKEMVKIDEKRVKEWLGNPTFKKTRLNENKKTIGLDGTVRSNIGASIGDKIKLTLDESIDLNYNN